MQIHVAPMFRYKSKYVPFSSCIYCRESSGQCFLEIQTYLLGSSYRGVVKSIEQLVTGQVVIEAPLQVLEVAASPGCDGTPEPLLCSALALALGDHPAQV